MKYTIDELQRILNVSNEYICEKMKISKNMLTRMKNSNDRKDYLKVKGALVNERVELIRYLK